MSPVAEKTKQHFSHPHPLIHHSDGKDYICDGCKTLGSGPRYRCHACDYDMHEYCSNCPEELSSSIHNHTLSLFRHKSQVTSHYHRFCDVCRHSVDGLFYRCKDCDFDAHPLCTQLPKKLRHVIDSSSSPRDIPIPPPVVGRKRRFLKKTLGVVASVIYDGFGIEDMDNGFGIEDMDDGFGIEDMDDGFGIEDMDDGFWY